MGEKYFKLRMIEPDMSVHHVVIWDGEKDWESHPPLQGLAASGEFGKAKAGKLAIVQISDANNLPPSLGAILEQNDAIVMWARDHKTYQELVKHADAASVRLH